MSWTVLVYMAADTSDSFYRYAMQDIGEIMQAQFGRDVKVFVHANRNHFKIQSLAVRRCLATGTFAVLGYC
jgi:hypothetical protein